MKKLTLAFLLLSLPALGADNVPTNYLPGYVYCTATNAGAVEIGLVTNTAYVAIPLASFAELTAGQANASTGDVRAVVFGFTRCFYTNYTANTNKTPTTISQSSAFSESSGNVTERITHVIQSLRAVGSSVFP